MSDPIPHADADFDVFQKQFVATLAASPAKYGLLATDVAALEADQTAWASAYPAHVDAHATALTASKAKEAAKAKLISNARACVHKLNGTQGVDDAARVAAGLHPRNGGRSHIGPPTTRPIGRLEPNGHGTLVIHVADEATPTRAAKPYGVHGCEIWMHLGDPAPADPSGFVFLGLATRSSFTDEHPAGDGGKSVYYLLRWQNGTGEAGPWSDVLAGKVPV